jgi:hypothetical protein
VKGVAGGIGSAAFSYFQAGAIPGSRLMSKQFVRLAIGAVALLIAVSAVEKSFAVTMGVHVGVNGDPFPSSGPYVVLPGQMPGAMVMSPTGGEIPLWMDPAGQPWDKIIRITPNSFPVPELVPGQVIPIWEKILILPPPAGTTIPRLPFTDWHEEIVQNTGIPDGSFVWGPDAILQVHNPNDPGNLPPLVEVPGMRDPSDPYSIWFGPWTPPLQVPPNGLPVWIHKQLIYTGTQTIPVPTAAPIDIIIREWPTVPEPTTFVLGGLGCVVVAGLRRRRAS